ncbi:PREDICTED: protein PLASTID MOVEMENT IMPAIRED 2-like [Lupinus angustifolius]|uniref:protein PLASTID MOVEMENT IMPAIRED 2-like n=1 Tax=Lupinus angustifolius TaxID=3871 RepID=UPI00092F0D75|nr:PREDICTED: protein PLASTID MOVEMENT IMPAIRED 2-like [Lupinus angustifolius]
MDITDIGNRRRSGSVKDVVNIYADKVSDIDTTTLKKTKVDFSLSPSRTRDLHMARKDIGKYKESRWTAESAKADAESELSNAKNRVKDLSSLIDESSYKAKAQMTDVETLDRRGKREYGLLAEKRNENYEYAGMMKELGYVKKDLLKLKLDVAFVLDEKSRAEKEIEESSSKMIYCSRTAEALIKEIEEANEEQVLAELARLEALKELADVEAERETEANDYSSKLESTRMKLKEVMEEIDESKELEMKLSVTISDIDALQNELNLVKEMDKGVKGDESTKQVFASFRNEEESPDSSMLQTITKELEAAKKLLALVREEGFQFMASMDIIRNELKNLTDETSQLKKQKGKVDSTLQNLNSKLLRAKSKLQTVSAAEAKTKSIVISLSHTLDNLKTESDEAKKEKDLIRLEVTTTKSEIEKSEFKIDMIEEKIQGLMQELEVTKTSEVLALEKLKKLTESTMRERALEAQHCSMITISKFEYEYLTNRASAAAEVADKKVAAAEAWIEAFKASENEIMVNTKIAQRELIEGKMVEDMEVYAKGKLLARRVSNDELDNLPRKRERSSTKNLSRGMPRKTIKSNGSVTPSPRVKFQKSASPGYRHVSPFTIKKRTKEFRMREVQRGSHTVASHGYTVARTHKHDWFILLLLVLIEIVLYIINPFYRFVGKDMMTDLKYPLKSTTVPFWAVPIYAVLLPMLIFLVVYIRRRDVYDLHHSILGLFFSILVTAVITEAVKNAVGRPRPDFFWRCFPDGKDVYDTFGGVICHGDKNVVKEGHMSFPSGHTSWSFAGLGFLSLYLSGKIKAFDSTGHVAKLCIVLLPLIFASLVGISLVDDYWHHWQDVFAGGLLGLVMATICYLQFFPPPYHSEGWGPYAYFRTLEELRGTTQTPNAQTQLPEAQVENQNAQSNHGCMGLGLARDNHGSTLDEIETGRR